MPTISQFFGITIRMHYNEHVPPHFHAHYQTGLTASIEIESLRILKGRLPRRALALVLEWAFAHRDELRENWRRVEEQKPLKKIKALE